MGWLGERLGWLSERVGWLREGYLALDLGQHILGADGARQAAIPSRQDSTAAGRRECRVQSRAQRAADPGDGAATVQVVASDRPAQEIGLHPTGRRTGLVHHEQPLLFGRHPPRFVGACSQRHRGFRADRQPGRGLERQTPITAVASKEVGDEVVVRIGQQPLGGVQLSQRPADPQHRHLIAQLDRLIDVVGDEDDGLAQFALKPQELVLQLFAHHRVDRAERLVHQHHRRVGGECPGHPHPLLLAPGELVRVALGEFGGQSHPLEEFERDPPRLGLRPAEQQGHRGDVVDDRTMREQPAALDDIADAAAKLVGVQGRGVASIDRDHTGGWLDHPVDHPQRRGLAAAGRADQHGDPASGGGEAQSADRRGSARIDLRDVSEADHASAPPGRDSPPVRGTRVLASPRGCRHDAPCAAPRSPTR